MSEPARIRVFSVDDHPLLREGVGASMNNQQDMVVVAQASNAQEAIQQFRKYQPDVTLMDLRLPDKSGIDAMIAVRAEFPEARVIILTTFEGDVEIQRALEAGARGYLMKSMPPKELVEVIRQVHAGKKRIPPQLAAQLAEHMSDDDLTAREIEVLSQIAGGNGNRDIARYLGRHGSKRVAKAVLISAVPPLMLKTEKNPTGQSLSVFDGLPAAYAANRPQFYKDITLPFYGYNRPGAKISEGIREHWWLQGMLGGVKPHYDCIKAFSETDFTEDLKKFDVPTLILHGDDDQIVPIGASGLMSAKLVKNATLKVYTGFPQRMPTTNADQINADMLTFFRQSKGAAG